MINGLTKKAQKSISKTSRITTSLPQVLKNLIRWSWYFEPIKLNKIGSLTLDVNCSKKHCHSNDRSQRQCQRFSMIFPTDRRVTEILWLVSPAAADPFLLLDLCFDLAASRSEHCSSTVLMRWLRDSMSLWRACKMNGEFRIKRFDLRAQNKSRLQLDWWQSPPPLFSSNPLLLDGIQTTPTLCKNTFRNGRFSFESRDLGLISYLCIYPPF